jgi:hypothetical protein
VGAIIIRTTNAAGFVAELAEQKSEGAKKFCLTMMMGRFVYGVSSEDWREI